MGNHVYNSQILFRGRCGEEGRMNERAESALEKAKALVNRLDEVHNDPRYQSVWLLYAIHGGNYTEPKYGKELTALKDALAALDSAADAGVEAAPPRPSGTIPVTLHYAGRGVPRPLEDEEGLSVPEVCICAAVIDPNNGEIVRGQRHAGPMAMIWARYDPPPLIRSEHQGFITSRNRFVGREEGLQLQKAAGIESAEKERGYLSTELTSEDLYGGSY